MERLFGHGRFFDFIGGAVGALLGLLGVLVGLMLQLGWRWRLLHRHMRGARDAAI
jgi:hypothetical protein